MGQRRLRNIPHLGNMIGPFTDDGCITCDADSTILDAHGMSMLCHALPRVMLGLGCNTPTNHTSTVAFVCLQKLQSSTESEQHMLKPPAKLMAWEGERGGIRCREGWSDFERLGLKVVKASDWGREGVGGGGAQGTLTSHSQQAS